MLKLNSCFNHIFTMCVLSLIIFAGSPRTAAAEILYSERASILELYPHDPDDWAGTVIELNSTNPVGSCVTSNFRPGYVSFTISKSAVQIYNLVLQAYLTNRQIVIQVDDTVQLGSRCKVRAVFLNTDGSTR